MQLSFTQDTLQVRDRCTRSRRSNRINVLRNPFN